MSSLRQRRGNDDAQESDARAAGSAGRVSSSSGSSKKKRGCVSVLCKVMMFLTVAVVAGGVCVYMWFQHNFLGTTSDLALTGIRKYTFGLGDSPHDITPRFPPEALQVVANLPRPPANVAVSAKGRVFFTFHPEHELPTTDELNVNDVQLAEWVPDGDVDAATGAPSGRGRIVPWPSREVQRDYHTMMAVRIVGSHVWALDHGNNGWHTPTLYKYALDTGALLWHYSFPRHIAGLGSKLTDFVVAQSEEWVYIADNSFWRGTPALIALCTVPVAASSPPVHRVRRTLEGTPSVTADKLQLVMRHRNADTTGKETFSRLRWSGGRGGDAAAAASGSADAPMSVPFRPHLSALTIDHRGHSVYFQPIGGTATYRVHTKYLKDWAWNDHQLKETPQKFTESTVVTSLTIDEHTGIIATDPLNSSIVGYLLAHRGNMVWMLVRDEKLLRWPSDVSYGDDGYVYVAASCYHYVVDPSLAGEGGVFAHAPFHIVRFRPSDHRDKLMTARGVAGQ